METIHNLQSTKEFELATKVEDAINSFSFSPKAFAASIPYWHRTLQQTFWRVIVACIKVYADENYRHDLRNQASHLEAKEMMQYLKEHGRSIPMV